MSQGFSDFDTNLLLTLAALFRDQNVTHAAARLNITQSALSARLTRLRQLLNDPLFIPAASGRGMIPTAHAAALQPELTKLIERLNDFVQTAHFFDPRTSKRVFRIAATDNPAAILAPELIPLIKSQAPNVRIAFTLPDKAQIAAHLEQGDVDLFVGAAEDGAGGLIAKTLFNEEFVTAQRIGHPRGQAALTLDEFCLLDHLLISTSGGHFSGMIDNALAEVGRERNVSVSIQSYALAPLVLTATDCICTLPRRFLERFTNVLDLFAPPLSLAPFQMNLFWHPRMRSDPAHVWLRKHVIQSARTPRS
ncbi:LysR family transcriptional regulator [Methylocapsa sp. S129]|uniref:LysR family transcriptional regulator n=1 Tax=Methylocapsa sp. S129 TaxID=1641869 RepID=UPI00131BAFEB|nr:LysR family transcriptional regulator [Methylocapsa sp. S129]